MPGFEGRIIGVCGTKATGKTAVVEGLVAFLKARGSSVGTVKHTHGEIAALSEAAAKDSDRHLAAGADCVVVSGDRLVQANVRLPAPGDEPGAARAQADGGTLDAAAAKYLFTCDYIVVEGFKRAAIPKIIVTREPGDLPEGLTNVVACVTEGPVPAGLPAFKPGEMAALGSFLFEQKVLLPQAAIAPEARLTVNGKPVPMNDFVRRVVVGVLEGLLTSLRDVETPTAIEIAVKHPR